MRTHQKTRPASETFADFRLLTNLGCYYNETSGKVGAYKVVVTETDGAHDCRAYGNGIAGRANALRIVGMDCGRGGSIYTVLPFAKEAFRVMLNAALS